MKTRNKPISIILLTISIVVTLIFLPLTSAENTNITLDNPNLFEYLTDIQTICDLSNLNETNSFNCVLDINLLINISSERCNIENFKENFCWVEVGNYFLEYEFSEEEFFVLIRDGNNASAPIFEEYTYDPEGIRIKTYNHEKNETVYTPFREFMMIINNSGTFNYTYIYDSDDTLVARINPDGSKWFYHADHLGSTTLITNESGDVIEYVSYLPYGQPVENTDAETKLYENKELDSTNQYYYETRYYDPTKRIFVQPDSLIPNVYDPQQLNIYAFERGNPYVYVDPSGNVPLPVITGAIGAAVGGIGGAVYAGYSSYKETGEVDWGSVGKGAGIGAVAGGVAGATLGLGTAAMGTSAGVSVASTIGTLETAGLIGAGSGVAGQVTTNLLSGNSLGNNVDMAGAIGYVMGPGAVYGAMSIGPKSYTSGLNENDISHIMQEKHNWGSVVDNPNDWNQVSSVINKVINTGKSSPYGNNPGVYEATKIINGKTVIVRYSEKVGKASTGMVT